MVWKPGESGNEGGRGKANRNKLSSAFIRALHTSFEDKGISAIERVIADDPGSYLRVIASIIPKELDITNVDKDLSDEQLADVIAALRSAISSGIVREVAGDKGDAEQAKDVQPVH